MPKLSLESGTRLLKRHAAGESPKSLAERYSISESAVYSWLSYAGLTKEWIRKVKALEHHLNLVEGRYSRQKDRLTIATSVIKRLQTSPKRRSLLASAIRAQYELPQSVANMIVGISPNAGTSKSAVRGDKVLVETMRRYLILNPGSGFKGMFNNFLRDQPGTRYNALRLYSENFPPKRRPAHSRTPAAYDVSMLRQGRCDQMWSMDFMEDILQTGEKYWLINVIDDFNREALHIRAMNRRSAKEVISSIESLIAAGRKPSSIRTDNGSEFRSKVYVSWAQARGISTTYCRRHTPTDNAYIESFNGTLRSELLNRYKYFSIAELQRSLDDWCLRYNFARPNVNLGGLSPLQYAHYCRSASQ